MYREISQIGRIGRIDGHANTFWRACAASIVVSMLGSAAAASDDDVRATFDRFVAAQNAHDIGTVKALLVGSPDFLWITRGNAIWGADAAIDRFASLYEGTWQLEPQTSDLKVMMIGERAAQIFVPIDFTIGAQGEQPSPQRFLMNMLLAETSGDWKISSILPIPVPPQ